MAKEFSVLTEQANVIKNEVEDGANTASRVGGMFVDLVEKIQDEHIDVVQELGNRNDAVVSQAKVTTEINKLNSASGYVTCTAAAGTAAKTVTQANFTLSTNCRLIVKMINYNTAASPTLNVNNTGAKPLYYNGEVASADNTWEDGETLDVYYDGTNYQASNVLGGSGSGGNMILEWDTDAATTRLQVKQSQRKAGMIVSYNNPSTGWVNEQYVGTLFTDVEWKNDANWIHGEEFERRVNLYAESEDRKGGLDPTSGSFVANESSNYYTTPLLPLNAFEKVEISIKGYVNNTAVAFYKEVSEFTYIPEYTIKFASDNMLEKHVIVPSDYVNANYFVVVCQNHTHGIYTPEIIGYKKTSVLGNEVVDKIIYEQDILKECATEDAYNGATKTSGEFLPDNINFITSDFIPIDDTLLGVEIFSAAEPTAMLVTYYTAKDRETILLDDSIQAGSTTIRKFVSKSEMPSKANYFSFSMKLSGTPTAYIYRDKRMLGVNALARNERVDLRNIYANNVSFFYIDGTLGTSSNALTNYRHIIVPVNEWKNFSFKVVMQTIDVTTVPTILFLKSNDITNYIDERCFATFTNSSYYFSTGFIGDDNIPAGCTYIAFNFRIDYISALTSFIRAEKRHKKGLVFTNNKLEYDANTPKYVVIDVTTDDLAEWPEDKTEHSGSVKMSSNGSVLVDESMATIEYQGSSTMAYPKKNFRIKFADDKKFGNWCETKKYNLKAYYLDMTQMREVLMYHMAHLMYCTKDISHRYPFSSFTDYPTGARGVCDLFPCRLNINGVFHGLYHFGLAKDKKNMMIDEDNPQHFAFEPASANNQQIWENAEQWDPVVHDTVPEAMKSKLQAWLDFVRTSTNSAFRTDAASHLDLDSWLEYLVLNQVIFGWDALSNNMQLVTYNGGNTFCVYPYDGDNTFGFMNNTEPNAYVNSNVFNYSRTCPQWISQKFILVFRQELCDTFRELYDKGVFTYQTFCSLIEGEIAGVPYSDYENNTEKWKYPGQYTNYPLAEMMKWYKERLWFLKNFFRYT